LEVPVQLLSEGGNVFKDSRGNVLTQRIAKANIMTTVQWLESITGIDFTSEKEPQDGLPSRWLGSTGRKPTSGDLDLQVDAAKVSKEALIATLGNWARKHGVDPSQYIKKSGISVHFLTAINGNPANGFVQTDFMFTNKPQWNQFVLRSDPASEYKGALRNIMINSIAKSMGYKLNQNDGIADRATNEIITDSPDAVAKMLLNPTASVRDLYSVENILKSLKMDPAREEKIADFRAHMQREGIPFDDTLDESVTAGSVYSEVHFLARLRDRIVNQGMRPIFEGVRIEHPEDMVFDEGSRGIQRAVTGIENTARDPKKATVKWDGKPAIIFGRKPNGDFVLTDKAGFLAKGYDGLATSPEMIAQIMAGRGGERSELVAIYQKLFPLLRAAVPLNFRGYIQGDLLYSNTPSTANGQYVFRPNTVTYAVPVQSAMGQRIGQSQAGVAVHTTLAAPGDAAQPIQGDALKTMLRPVSGLLILDPYLNEPKPIKLDPTTVNKVKQIVTSQGTAIDQLFNPQELRNRKITNLPALMKTYINSKVREGNFNNLMSGFGPWIQAKEPAKAPRIFEWATENKEAVAATFQSFLDITRIKNELVRQLDAQASDVNASIDGVAGHEGYVAYGMKFVDRMRFSAANFARNNPVLT
jgi:hypothetical protein